MNRCTAILLVVLRLAIGYHFLVEGWSKIHSTDVVGATEGHRPFSSEGYFRESPGPMGRLMRHVLGDPDEEALSRLTVQPLPPSQEPARYPAQNRIPPGLAKDWDDYLARFEAHYGLDPQQRGQAEVKLQQAKHNTTQWLLGEQKKEVSKTFPSGTVEEKLTMSERIAEYRKRVQEVKDAGNKELWLLGRDVEKQRLVKAKTELAQLRTGLLADLNEKSAEMKKTLDDILTEVQRSRGPVPDPPSNLLMERINLATRWGLFAIGAGLLLGLFTRTWCVLGAAFLLTTYLCVPPFPWYPTPLQSEGNYFLVNKNLVEMLALLVLATTRSGRWLGLDALVHGLATGFRNQPDADASRNGEQGTVIPL